MYGAIIGDICGQPYEGLPAQENIELFKLGCTFTDDTVCTCAIAEAIMLGFGKVIPYEDRLRNLCLRHPYRWYGPKFIEWFINPDSKPYNSFGNGAIMRVSPVAWAFDNIDDVLAQAELSAAPSHNHPEGIKGARAIAHSIFLARTGSTKDYILQNLEFNYGYPLLDEELIMKENDFTMTCQKSIPTVMCALKNSDDFESCIKKVISYGWDTDTNAAIAGSIAEGLYGIPSEMKSLAISCLTVDLDDILYTFDCTYGGGSIND